MENYYANQLQDVILSWDYWELEAKLTSGGGPIRDLPAVPHAFGDRESYVHQFEQLLLEEAAAQLLRGGDEGLVLLSRRAAVGESLERPDGSRGLLLTFQEGVAATFSENDVFLMSEEDPQGEGTDEVLHCLGIVEGKQGERSLRVRVKVTEDLVDDERGRARVKAMGPMLGKVGKAWWVLRLSNTSTIQREWAAVHSLKGLDRSLLSVILSNEPRKSAAVSDMTVPRPMFESIERSYNDSQTRAVTAGLSGASVVLIQGPPGTGKTRTILGLLSILMHAAPTGAFSGGRGRGGEDEGASGAATDRERGEVSTPGTGTAAGSPAAALEEAEVAAASIPADGAVPARVAPTPCGELTKEARFEMWRASCPWLRGAPDPRVILPPELADPGQAFGLLSGNVPVRVGARVGPRARVLVCAPANSALDEIVLRLITNGLTDRDGATFTPNVVRVGVNIHHSVRSVSLEALVEARMAGSGAAGSGGIGASSGAAGGGGGSRGSGEGFGGGASARRFGAGNTGKAGGAGAASAPGSFERDRARTAVLEEANVVCSTLAFAGSSAFSRMTRKFDVVVVDEAAQAVEPSVLVPMAMAKPKQVYLVGDPEQLPATVLSRRALDAGYSRSLFRRLQSAGHPVHRLDTQYRMNPRIREFPSKQFYSDALLDGPNVEAETRRPWHELPGFGPISVVDVREGRETTPEGSNSLINEAEAQVVVALYRELAHRFPDLIRGSTGDGAGAAAQQAAPSSASGRVGVIAPYKAQVTLLRRMFERSLGPEASRLVDVNTVDGFQGREKDVVIFSTVRSSPRGAIGFVADERRVNVGLTRARCSMLLVCNARALRKDAAWGGFIRLAAGYGCAFPARAPYSDYSTLLASGQVAPLSVEDVTEPPPKGARRAFADANLDDSDADLYSEDEDTRVDLIAARTRAYGVKVKKHLKHKHGDE